MSFQNEKDRGKRKSEPQPKGAARKKRPDNPELGNALRTVYQRTVEEDIPPEMLDLLGKLG